MSTFPKISVIIVTWNVGSSLRHCLASVKATKYPNLDVLVVDNNSADDTEEIIGHKAFSALKIRYIRNTENLGFPIAANQGLKSAKGEFILLLHPDARLPVDFFDHSFRFFSDFPDAAIMGPEMVDTDGTVQGSVLREPSVLLTVREFWLHHRGLTLKYSPLGNTPVPVDAISTCCMYFPRHTMDMVGVFAEKVFMYYEDLDFCRRIRLAGWKVYFNPRIKVIHERGLSTIKAGDKPLVYARESSLWYNGWLKHWLMYFIIRSGRFFWE